MSQLGQQMAGAAGAEPEAGEEPGGGSMASGNQTNIGRVFEEMEELFAGVRSEMLWNWTR
jgi:hypothetical protein